MSSLENKGNLLGDVRAEHDHSMLDTAFYDWQDYKILAEADGRFLVVGRRGTGKSALTYRLMKDWKAQKNFVVVVAPNEEDVFGLRAAAAKYGQTLTRIRSAIKTGWRYALIMELGCALEQYYKTQNMISASALNSHLKRWKGLGDNIVSRLKKTLNDAIVPGESAEESISELATRLNLNSLTGELDELLRVAGKRVMILIDRLDEGYESDEVGIGIVDGIIYGSDDLRTKTSNIRTILFLRDNIFRAIQISDQDFSRNVEGSVLRLHWDVQELFYLVCKRIRQAFSIDVESDVKVWNSVTANELHGREGFKSCLKLTLYRPRDLISLLNTAFYNAKKQGRKVLIVDDLDASANHISEIRFDDLRKEYSSVFPGIDDVAKSLAPFGPSLNVFQATSAIEKIMQNDENPLVFQHLKILGTAQEVLKALYGVGFIGMADKTSGNIVFSHDGKKPERLFDQNSMLLIHPCYWSALGIKKGFPDQNISEQIYDEYDITISSEVKEQRDLSIGGMIAELGKIELGNEDASQFEDWAKRAIELISAGKLTNIQLKPNGNGSARRDIVGTNMATEGFWRRIREDYSSRQIIFEVKNFEKMSVNEYRQCASYLGNEYGRFAFLICRDTQKELSKGGEMEAFREFYNKNEVVVKLTASFLVSLLSKLRSPQKFDTLDDALTKHIDNHIRLYANGQGGVVKKKGR